MMKIYTTLAFVLLASSMIFCQNKTTSAAKPTTPVSAGTAARKKVPMFENDINAAELKKLKAEFPEIVIIDLRPKSSAAAGIIPGAVNLEWGSKEFANKIGTMDIKKSYIVYCADGSKSINAQRLMKTYDFLNVANLKGGYKEYVKSK
jgi:rhodanese-related sulfurtransferase